MRASNKLQHRARPALPVYHPEAAAAAICGAAAMVPRELILGRSSLVAGSMAGPGVIDSTLATRAYEGQQTSQPAQDRVDNLFEPVPEEFNAHGRFDDEARPSVGDVPLAAVRGISAFIGAALVAGAAAIGGRRRD